MILLANYIKGDPALRSLSLAENSFTDEGLGEIISALNTNSKLNHLNLLENRITDVSIKTLEFMITDTNMSLYSIEIDEDKFDPEILQMVMN